MRGDDIWMATLTELQDCYNLYYDDRQLWNSTVAAWVKKGKLKAKKDENERWDYDLESFKKIILSDEYKTKLKAVRKNPEKCVGQIRNHLLITGIVPEEEKNHPYKGTLMYCKCLICGKENIQVRFSYVSGNGNYERLSCGCMRKVRHFMASLREGVTEEFILEHDDIDKMMFVHKMLAHIKSKYYTQCPIEEYKKAIDYFYYDQQFNAVYDFWGRQKNEFGTFYNWAKPSLDHITPISKGGLDTVDNLQVLTVFENLAKRDMTWEEWCNFKRATHSTSDYYIENIINNKKDVIK